MCSGSMAELYIWSISVTAPPALFHLTDLTESLTTFVLPRHEMFSYQNFLSDTFPLLPSSIPSLSVPPLIFNSLPAFPLLSITRLLAAACVLLYVNLFKDLNRLGPANSCCSQKI